MSITTMSDFTDKANIKNHLKQLKKAKKKTECFYCATSKTMGGKPFLLLASPNKKVPSGLLKEAKKEGVLLRGSYRIKKGQICFYFASGDAASLKTKILSFCAKNSAPLPAKIVEVYIKGDASGDDDSILKEDPTKKLNIGTLKGKMRKKVKKAKENVAEMHAEATATPWEKTDTTALLDEFLTTPQGKSMEKECNRLISEGKMTEATPKVMKKFIKKFVKGRSGLSSYATMEKALQVRLLGHANVSSIDYMRQLAASIEQNTLEKSGSYADFLTLMTTTHKANFITEVSKALVKSAGSSSKEAKKAADSAFLDVVASLYRNEISGLGGSIVDASEEQRQLYTERFFQETKKYITSLGPVSAGEGATLLWSGIGGDVVRDASLMDAALEGDDNLSDADRAKVISKGKALAGTPIGQLFDNLDLALNCSMMGWSRNVNMWTSVSKEFASNAKGDVQIFLSEGVTAWSVFWNVELPALRNNPDVNKIYCHYLNSAALTEIKRIKGDASLNAAEQKEATVALVNDPSVWVHKELEATPLITPNATEAQQQQFDAREESLLNAALEEEGVDWMDD